MPIDYETVGAFYETLSKNLAAFVARVGEKEAFCGDRNLQLSRKEIDFQGCDPVICSITAAQGFRCHRQPGRRRREGECRFALPALHRDTRGARAAARREPGFSAGVSRGRESGVAPTGARGCARVAGERRDRGDGGSRQHGLHADAAADIAFVPRAAPASGQGAVRGSRARADARHVAARRARSAPAGGTLDTRIATVACRSPRCATPRRYHRASAPENSSSSGCMSWRTPRRRWRQMAMRG